MSGIYAADGSWNISAVSGSSRTGLYSTDGSFNVVVSDGLSYKGIYHPCGAYWVTPVTSGIKGRYAADGSLNIAASPYVVTGAARVTVISGTVFDEFPPALTWFGDTSDATPDFYVDLPQGNSLPSDVVLGDLLRIEYSTDAVTWLTYLTDTLSSADIAADTITENGITSLANGSYFFRTRLERGAIVFPWSTTTAVTINVIGTAGTPLGLLLALTKSSTAGQATGLLLTITKGT